MGGQTTTTQSTSQQSQTAPWAATQPQLKSLLGNLNNYNTAVTPQQSAAASALQSTAANLPGFGGQIANTATTLLSGGGANYGNVLSGA